MLGCAAAAAEALLGAGKKSPTPSAKQEYPKLASTGESGNTGPAADKTSMVCTACMWGKKPRTQIPRKGASKLCCALAKVSAGGQTYINITLVTRWVVAILDRVCDGNAS